MKDLASMNNATWNSEETDKLVNILNVKLGSPFVLVSSGDVSDGLCNENAGILRGVSGPSGNANVMWVELKDASIGARLRSQLKSKSLTASFHAPACWTPIQKVSLNISHHGEVCSPFMKPIFQRTQFPLDLAFATTVHAAQGSTYDTIGIDLIKHKPGLSLRGSQLYTALSRC